MTIGFGLSADIWIYEWVRDTLDETDIRERCRHSPVWTPDGRRIAYTSASEKSPVTNLYWKRADGDR